MKAGDKVAKGLFHKANWDGDREQRHWAGLLLAVALGAALRLVALDRLPPGLYHDEAFNGLDALRVLAGDRPIYFPANNGREPLYIYLVAGAVAWLGRTPGAVRLPAALAGTLTIAAAYGLAGALYNRRVAFFTAMITATTLWPVALSRQGFRAALLPLLLALCLWQAARAWRGQHLRDWALAGGLYGLSFYTYLAARLTPFILLPLGLYLAWVGRLRRLWPGALVAGLTAALVAPPLALYALNHPDVFFTRAMQVTLFNPAIHGGDLPGALMRQMGRALGMFTLHGADEVRHNVPGRPVFDPAMSVAFLVGVWLALSRAIGGRGGQNRAKARYWAVPDGGRRTGGREAFVLIWTLGMLAPTILSEGAPDFLRAAGVMPTVFILPALGLEATWRLVTPRLGRPLASALLAALLLLSTGLTLRDYFGPSYAASTALYDAFDGPAADLVLRINRFLGAGWQGGLRVKNTLPQSGRQVILDRRLWAFSETVPFLCAVAPGQGSALTVLTDLASPPPQGGGRAWLVVLVPTEARRAMALLPQGVQLRAENGPMVGGLVGVEPFQLYVAYQAQPAEVGASLEPAPTPLARFAQPIELLRASVQPEGPQRLRVTLLWAARGPIATDYTVFVHLLAHGEIVAQDDGFPASGLLPTSWWRPGDQIEEERVVTLSEGLGPDWSIEVGLYRLDTLERLAVVDENGQPIADKVQYP